jgi:hypothetical protein
MTGMMSLFFSDKFYYAFKDSYPFELIAVWGGGLEDAFFNFNQAYFSQFCKI